MPDSFAHLHVHTEYSMLDGAARIAPLFAETERLNMPAVGMTDHGNMYGAWEFYQQSRNHSIKPIIGIEAYVAPESRFHRKPVFWGRRGERKADEYGEGGDVSGAGAYTHMTMLAENAAGLRNLYTLSSRASLEGFYRKPRMDKELIAENHAGIIATTGCPSGEVQTRLRLGQHEAAMQAASDYKDIFGADNFFLELMDHGLGIERSVREGLLHIGKELNLSPLATNDSHYVTQDQAEMHSALLCVQSGKTLSDPDRFKFGGDGYYLKSAAEMRAYWDSEAPGACDSTLAIAQRVQSYDDVFAHRDLMPVFTVPEGYSESGWLREETMKGLRWRFPHGIPEGYRERIDTELDVITQKGFPAYFLVVADLINYARGVGIRVGPGRGSAAGSLVAYVLGITNLDPIPQQLLFERFLNPERASMPDIDIDFDDRRRGEMIRYVTDKYGDDKVSQVLTQGRIKARAAIKDAARVLQGAAGYSLGDKLSKAFPPDVQGTSMSLAEVFDPDDARYNEAAPFRTMLDQDPDSKAIVELGRNLEGLIRNAGVHACAVIMSSRPLTDSVPVWRRDDGTIITGFPYTQCEELGLLKMDFLGLRTLTVIGDAIDNIKTNRGEDIDLDRLGMDDPEAYKLLAKGDTLGMFQIEGDAMQDLLRRLQPTGFDDIVAVNALYRPGPMGMNAHNDYADRKNKRQKVKPIHPELAEPLKEILAPTFGLIVYQEQIMAIAQRVAGYSLGRADILRRAMGKKKKEVLDQEYETFRAGMRDNGFCDEAIKALWDTILPFAGYAFNKSHAAAYGLISYWTAYLKANYPAEFMAALLTSVGDNKDKSAAYLADCRKKGLRVLPPDVNESGLNYSSVGDDIRFGLGAIRNVGANVAESIIAVRAKKSLYRGFVDFLKKSEMATCNKSVISSLIKAGAFDSTGETRLGLYRAHEGAIDMLRGVKKNEERGQFDLFGDDAEEGNGDTDPSVVSGVSVTIDSDEWDRKTLLGFEREMLGLYVSSHPLAGAETLLDRHSDHNLADIAIAGTELDGKEVRIAGMISRVERKITKAKQEQMAIVTVEDLANSLEVVFFPRTYAAFAGELIEDSTVSIQGKVSVKQDSDRRNSVFAEDLRQVDVSKVVAGEVAPVVVAAPLRLITEESVLRLRQYLSQVPGETPVRLKVVGGAGGDVLFVVDYKVELGSQFYASMKSLFGPRCVGVL